MGSVAEMSTQALICSEDNFQHILRVSNTNVNGRDNVRIAMTKIRGIGRRYSDVCLKRAGIPDKTRAGEMAEDQINAFLTIVQNPRDFKIPDWFLNRQRDFKDGKTGQIISSQLDTKMRDDLERLKKIRNHRGLRHYWGLTVRGQHTKTTGRRGKTMGVAKKK